MNWCTCRKRHKLGYEVVNDWGLCPLCHLPEQMFLENLLTEHGKHSGTYLNLFRHGPHHNELWTVQQLLYACEELPSSTWITSYTWTDDVVVGSESGRTARVWVWSETLEEKVDEEGVQVGSA